MGWEGTRNHQFGASGMLARPAVSSEQGPRVIEQDRVGLTAAAAIASAPTGRFPTPGSDGTIGLRIPYADQ